MATASPTPMGGSHFAHRRTASRNAYMNPPSRPQLSRPEAMPTAPAHARTYSLNDSSDDEIPLHMLKFSAATNALLNGSAPVEAKQPTPPPETEDRYNTRFGSADPFPDRISPAESRVHSPFPRRVVRLSSGTPSTFRRSISVSSAAKRLNEQAVVKAESPSDLSTPAQVPRTVRIPVTSSGNNVYSGSSSGKVSHRTNSASRNEEEEMESQEYPTTAARTNLAINQGSVSKYGSSTIGRTRYGAEEAGLQSSMRVKRLGKGQFLSGPARRGRRRMTEEEQSPVEEQGDALDAAGSSQEPESQESQAPDSQEPGHQSAKQPNASLASLYTPAYHDFDTNGSPPSNRDLISSVLRSKSPPPPTLSDVRRSEQNRVPQVVQPFKVPAPRVNLPSSHDQENAVSPSFKRNKQAPLIHLDIMEKVPVRSESVDMDAVMKAVSPERRVLAPRSRNTPLRPAPPPPKMSILDAATSNAGAATSNASRKNRLKVNGKVFTKLDVIGRGGSSKVYRVMAENSQFLALKRVSLNDVEESAIHGFKGEIDLLKKLAHVERVIRLYDWELNEEKQILSVLMEMGELDMNQILQLRLKTENAKFDASFVRHYWKEMLECLQAIHECDIVHSDLKPHNFVLVKGRLKLIDFGIANAIETDETVNVHRDTQIGTPNYMSPESLIDSNAKPDSRGRIPNEPKLMKLGKPSDIWSLGCILYQMVYGRAPFGHIQNAMHRCQAIINWKYEIEYPTLGVGNVPVPGSLIRTLKKCLNRDQHQRPSATELLSDRDPFLNPVELDEDAIPLTEELLGRILMNASARFRERTPTDAELMTLWPKSYFERLKKNMADGKVL